MNTLSLRFQSLLQDGLIRRDVQVDVDQRGLICRIAAAPADCNLPIQPGLAIPGMPNLHSHAFQRLMAGLAEKRQRENDSFWSWRELMYRIASGLSPEDLGAVAQHLYIQLLQCGFTGIAEFHYLHHDARGKPFDDAAEMSRQVLKAAREAGMGMTLLPVLYQRGGFDDRPLGRDQQRFFHTTDDFLRLLEALETERDIDCEIGLAIHSLRAVDMASINEAITCAPAGRPRHIHIAEQPLEVRDCIEVHGTRPVSWLADQTTLDSHWTLVHATHVDADEVATIAQSGAVAGLCPTTEANLGDGLFSLVDFLAREGQFGVGTDSHVAIDPAVELRWLEYGQRLISGRRCLALAGGETDVSSFLWQRAARGGALACGRPIGSIAVDQRADIVTITSEHDSNPNRLLARHLFGEGLTDVGSVWVGGRQVVSDGKHPLADQSAAQFSTVARKLL